MKPKKQISFSVNSAYSPVRDDEAEWAVLSGLFAEPSLLSSYQDDATRPENFWHPVAKLVAKGLKTGIPPDTVAMGEFVSSEHGKEALDLCSEKVFSCGSISVPIYTYWIKRLTKATQRREMQKIAFEALVAAEDKEAVVESLIPRWLEQVRNLETFGDSFPKIVSAADMENEHIPEPDEIISGVLHRGCKMVLGGTSKSMKTWTLMELAMCVSLGAEWWHFSTRKSRVLYVNFEINPWTFRQRLRKIASARGVCLPENLEIWNLRGHAADIATLRPRIVRELKKREYGLLVIDPAYKMYGQKDENRAGDMAQLMNELDKIATEANVGIAFGHHFTKGNSAHKSSIDRMSGSGVFARDPDAIFILTTHETEGVFSVDVTLRDFQKVDPFCVKWEYPRMVLARGESPECLKGTNSRKFDDGDLLALIEPSGSTFGALSRKADQQLEMSKTTLSRYLRRLVTAGRVLKETTQMGDCYKLQGVA